MRERHEDLRLSAFLDDELPESEALEVTRHLAGCARCLDELESIRRTRAAVRDLPRVEPPPTLLDGVAVAAVAFPRPRRVATAVLAGIALGLTLYVLAGEDGNPLAPSVDRFVVESVEQTGGGAVLTPVDTGP